VSLCQRSRATASEFVEPAGNNTERCCPHISPPSHASVTNETPESLRDALRVASHQIYHRPRRSVQRTNRGHQPGRGSRRSRWPRCLATARRWSPHPSRGPPHRHTSAASWGVKRRQLPCTSRPPPRGAQPRLRGLTPSRTAKLRAITLRSRPRIVHALRKSIFGRPRAQRVHNALVRVRCDDAPEEPQSERFHRGHRSWTTSMIVPGFGPSSSAGSRAPIGRCRLQQSNFAAVAGPEPLDRLRLR